MNDDGNKRKLYNALSKDYDMGSYEQFSQDVEDEGKRRKLYDAIKGDYDLPDFNGFSRQLAGERRQAPAPAQSPAPTTQRQQQPQRRQQRSKAGRQQRPWRPSPAQMAGFSATIAGVRNTVAQGRERMKNLSAYTKQRMKHPLDAGVPASGLGAGKKNKPTMLSSKNVVAGDIEYNPETGKMEQTYLTQAGNKHTSRFSADMEQRRIDEEKERRLHPVESKLREAEAEKERLAGLMRKRMEEIDARKTGHPVAGLIRDLADESHGMPGGLVSDNGMRDYRLDPRYRQLEAAARKNHQTIKTLRDKSNGQMNEFWHTLGNIVTNGYTFSDGQIEAYDALSFMEAQQLIPNINRKIEKGGALTKEEESAEAVLRDFATDEMVQDMYGKDYGPFARAATAVGTSLGFMKDIMLTGGGAGALTKGIYKGVVKGGMKLLARKGVETGLKAAIGKGLLKATGVALGTTAAGAMITNTTSLNRTLGEAGRLMAGHVGVNENGGYTIDGQKGMLEAIAEAERDIIGEYQSEMFGEFIPGGGKLVRKGLEKIGLSRVSNALTSIGNKEWYRRYSKLLKAGGWNGLPGEGIEEYEGLLFDALTGHGSEALEQVQDPRTHIDIWLGCATMGALLGSVPAVAQAGSTAQYYRYKHKVNKSGASAASIIGDRWNEMQEQIDGTPNGGMVDVLTQMVLDPSLNHEQKNAVLDYARNLTKMRGYNLATANNAGEEKDPDAEAANNAYGEGYNATEDTDMQDVKNRMEVLSESVGEFLGEDVMRDLEASPVDTLRTIRGFASLSDGQKQMAVDYVNAKSAYDGLIQRVRDDIDSEIAQSDAMVDSRVAREEQGGDGMIHPATLKEQDADGHDKQVFVVSGNVRMMDDGSMIDTGNSDETIIVRDAETGKLQFMSPGGLLSLGDVIDAEQLKEETRQQIRERKAREAADKTDGTLAFAAGDTYQFPDEAGGQHTYAIMQDLGDGMVAVALDGNQQMPVSMSKQELQAMADARNRSRVTNLISRQGQQTQAEVHNSRQPQYNLNEEITLQAGSEDVRAIVTSEENEDGLIEVESDQPINGRKVNMFSREQLDGMLSVPQIDEERAVLDGVSNVGDGLRDAMSGQSAAADEQAGAEPMPMIDVKGRMKPDWSKTTPQRAHAYLYNERGLSRENADAFVENNRKSAESELAKLRKKRPKMGTDLDEFEEKTADWQGKMDDLQRQHDYWKAVRHEQFKTDSAEQARISEKHARRMEEAKRRRAEEERLREEAERKEREAINGVPDMVDDTPQDARARGYRRVNGYKVDRQEPLQALQGKAVSVKFSNDVIPQGNVAVIDARQLQPSHAGGQRNPLHFIDEAQPKERIDDASRYASSKIAGNIRPEEITSSVTAYTGAPTINARGEVIQGNNRSDALRQMWQSYPEEAARYKQYLIGHAADFGLRAEDIEAMQSPVLVNMLDVEDAEAITLGQFVAQDTESGGTERIKAKNAVQKMGNDMRTFANLLLKSADEEATFAQLLDDNGTDVLKWMSQKGYITPTQYKSAFDGSGNVSGEAKNDLRSIMYQSVFRDGGTRLEEMFNAMPVKAQKAILATAYRDYDSPIAERMVVEIQNSIRAFTAMSQDEAFKKATNFKDAREAAEMWKRSYQFDDATGESYLPSENFSNFALLLATLYKGANQTTIQGTFNKLYDLIQGTQEASLFEQPDNTPRTLAQAIRETLNIEYNGQRRSNVLAGDSPAIQGGQQGSNGNAETGERAAPGEEPADGGGGTGSNSEEVNTPQIAPSGQLKTAGLRDVTNPDNAGIGTNAAKTKAQDKGGGVDRQGNPLNSDGTLYIEEVASIDDITDADFEEPTRTIALPDIPNNVRDAIGAGEKPVIIKKNIFERNGISHSDLTPEQSRDILRSALYNADLYGQNQKNTKPYNWVVINITDEAGKNKLVLLEVNQNNNNVEIVHWHYLDARGLEKLRRQADREDGQLLILPSIKEEVGALSDPTDELSSAGKDNTLESDLQGKAGKSVENNGVEPFSSNMESASADVNTSPTDAQKEAGNYRKGHLKFDGYDISIENPKGSVRRGTDADGNEWEQEMQNTYGYIRGTEGVDGDHIDVFLSDDPTSGDVFVVDQVNKDGSFDEHKVMYGFPEIESARKAYLSNYEEGWQGLGAITPVSKEEFKKWIESSHRKTKPFAEYSGVKPLGDTLFGEKVVAEPQESAQAYTIEPAEYTNKKGKTTPMHLVRFSGELTKEQVRAGKELVREPLPGSRSSRGWWDAKRGGFMVRSEEAARELSEALTNDEAVQDAQPMSVEDLSAVNDHAAVQDAGEARLSGHAGKVKDEPQTEANEEPNQEEKKSGSKWVDDADAERFEELRKRLHKKLNGQLNMGIDPEAFAIGVEMSYLMLKHGARKFGEFARQMIDALGENVRPYLKSFYNGARDLPEMADYEKDLTPYGEVRAFDVMNFDKEGAKDIIATAEHITREQEAGREAREATRKLKEERNANRTIAGKSFRPATEKDVEKGGVVYYGGKPAHIMMVIQRGEQTGAARFSKPRIDRVYLTNGKECEFEDLMVEDEAKTKESQSKEKKSRKKAVTSQGQTMADLFSGLLSEEELNDNSNDTARTRQAENGSREYGTVGSVPANRDRVLDTNSTERTDRGETSSVSDKTVTVADGTRTRVPGQRSGGSTSRRDNRNRADERELSDGGRSISDGAVAAGRNDDRGTSGATGSVQSGAGAGDRGGKRGLAERGGRGNVKQPEPKFKRNYLYPENSSEIDNMTPQQRLTANVEALEVVRTLMKEGREATPEEREILGRYRGWGGVELGRAYSTYMMRRSFTDRWGTPTEQGKLLGRLADVIDELDPNGERGVLSAINRAALTSYYTPTGIARAMNRFAELAGFKGGNMLDPSMGSGVFEGTMSKGIQQRTMIHGVELDWLTGQIARNLYPDANVLVTGYEQAGTADNAYDVVLSNIPFGDISVTDKSWKHDSSPVRKAAQNRIHNYFAVKMLDNTRPGGLCVIMTSNAILDTRGNQIIREHLADNAEILGVVRLPDNTFKGAGTSVVTDVIFLRKYKDDADRAAKRGDEEYSSKIEKPFLSSSEMPLVNPTDGKTYQVAVNGYFTANKGMMIGDAKAGGQYRADQFGLVSSMSSDELAAAMSKLVEKKIVGDRKGKLFDTHKTEREVHQAVSEAYKGDGNYISSGNIVEHDGMFGVVTSTKNKYGDVTSTFTEMPSLKAKSGRIRAMLPIREAMKELIACEIGGKKETFLQELRKKLQGAYDGYVKKFGRLNDKGNDFLTEDIDGYTLRSLERMKDNKFVGLSDIFTKTTIKPALDLSTAKTPADAISLSLAEYGEINPSFMEEVLGAAWSEQCGETLFRTPFTEDVYETADAYLSGDVKTKLEQAREAAKQDKSFERNVEALEAIQPKDIPFEDISIRMGARWIPAEVYTDFMYDMFGIRKNDWKVNKSGVEYMPEVDQYVVNVSNNELGGEADAWRTSRRAASEVFTAALQDKSLSVFDTIKADGKETKVLNKEETELLNNKIQDLRTAFEDWLSHDPEREEMLMRMYNDKFNRTVLRKFDGSHLNVAGLMGKELRPHQKDAVWMLINNRGGIVDHIVGAGKTLVMQSAIMEMRRMGIAKKPMIVGLKVTVAQIAKEFREAYPSARILAPTEKDFSKENRKKFMSQIALNDYDCVILSHDQYEMLPHTEEVERSVIDEQMMQLDAAIEYLYGQSDKSQLTKKQIKGLEKRKANLEAKLTKLLDRKIDREFTFEGLGVDYLFVDECQHFKSLPYVSTYDRVAGLGDKKGSQRAIALLNGVRYLQRMHQGDRGTVFLSGTTISNSLSEIYHLLNYLRPSEMERLGMTTFDAWAGNYAIHTAELEYGVTNELKEKDRFRSLTNIPELSKMYAEIADVRNDMNLKLPKPKMRSHVVTVPQSDIMQEINREIVNMVKNKDGSYFGIASTDKTPWGLLASTLSAKAAINPRLIDDAMEAEGGKIPAVCENVKKIYDQFAEQRGTQLIFCDTGVSGKGKKYDAYSDIINRLVNDYGMPRKEIADIHEANTDEKRKALFAKVNDGSVRILIGGTKNMGTGVNVQKRIVAMHHVDVPWTPADREQREGRGVRQGNEIARDFNDDNVDVYFYATEGSLDMYKYQLQETKGKLFAQFKSGTIGDRTFDEGEAEGDFDPAEVVAMLSGNPVIFEKSKQDKKVEKLRRAKRAYESDWQRRRSRYEELQQKKRNFERLLSLNASDVRDLERGGFTADEEGKYPATVTVSVKDDYSSRRTFDKPKEAGGYIHSLLKQGKKVQLSGFNQKANITVPITDAGLFGKPVAELESYGGIKYTVEVSDDDTAAGVAFRNLLQKVYSNRKVYERNLEDVNTQLTGAAPGEKKFPKHAELDEALKEKKRLDDEYKKLSDGESKPKNGDGVLYRDAGLAFSDNPDEQQNIENGLTALERLANGEEEVSDAMRREELAELGGTADIAFLWGTQGQVTPQGRYKGGEGFLKIIEKHGIGDAIKVVETIAKGKIGEPYGVAGGQRVDMDFKNHHTTVSLFRFGESKSWVLTGYTTDNNTDAKGRGGDLSNATQSDPIRTRAELGAALKSDAKIRQIFEISNLGDENLSSDHVMLREVDDAELGKWLESQEKVKVYRSMVLIDGKLYPPMSSKEADGKALRGASEFGKWEEAEEAPEKAVERNGKWYFPLRKDNGKMLYAAYNPYIHTSRTMLNDQFSEAQDRENLVVVEMEVPVSELDSEYKAYKAKDTTGAKQWKAGVIQGQLSGTREVILTRWAKPVRIVPTDEVADHIVAMLQGQVDVMPSNVVTPQLRNALETRGVQFVETNNQGKITDGNNKGKTWASVYGKKRKRGSLQREGSDSTTSQQVSNSADVRSRAAFARRQWRRAHDLANDWIEKLGIGEITSVYERIGDVPGNERFSKRRLRSKGWYDPETGRIAIVMNNHHSPQDVLQTILHEAVAHYGLRKLFGKNFDNFLDNVYDGADILIKERIAAKQAVLVSKGKNAKRTAAEWRRVATEEYLAELAESTDFENAGRQPWAMHWFNRIKSWFLDMLHSIGLKNFGGQSLSDTISDNELRYILWRSYKNMSEPGRYRNVFQEAEDIAMQNSLGVGNYAKSAAMPRRETEQRAAKVAEPGSGNAELDEQYKKLKAMHPDALFLFKMGAYGYRVIGGDRKVVGRVFGRNAFGNDSEQYYDVPTDKLGQLLPRLVRGGFRVGIVDAPRANVVRESGVEDYVRFVGEGTGDRIMELFNQAIDGKLKGKPVAIGRITKEGKEYLENLSGVKMKDVVDFVLNPSDMVHIYNDHFGDNEKDKGNNVPLTEDDIRNIAEIISHPDSILFGTEAKTGRNMFFFFKKNSDGTYNLAEVYGDRKGNLTAKSFYNTKKEASQRVMEIKRSLLPTSVTYSGATPSSGAKIPTFFETTSVDGEEIAEPIKSDAFKQFFGDWENAPEEASKMVDETGKPKVFYHNTPNEFTVFDATRNGTHNDAGWLGDGFYFYGVEHEGDGYGKNKMAVYLNIRNPYYATSEDMERLAEANSREASIAFRQQLEEAGYDGVYYNGDLREEAVAFYPNQIKSAPDNVGTYDAGNDDIRYRDSDDATPRALSRDAYERLVLKGTEQFAEAVQDSMRSLKNLYLSIIKAEGTKGHIEDVAGYENAYLAENRMHSMSQGQIDAWEHDFMQPLVKIVNKITGGDKAAYSELIDYMMAKHGLERNQVLAERDFKKYQQEYPQGTKTIDDFREKDYSGLTALTGEDDVQVAEDIARQMASDFEREHDLEITELWDRVNAATKSSLEKAYMSGIMSRERYEQIRDMFEYYIPLQGFDEAVAEDVYAYVGSDGTRMYGTPIRTAKGRKSKADDPLATIEMNGEAAIRQGNRNIMKQRFLNFVQNHPSDLVSVSDVWLRHNDVTDEWEQYFDADLKEDDTPDEVERKTREFEERMEQLAESDPGHYKRGGDLPGVPYRVLDRNNAKQHQVLVRRNGNTFVLTINGNPRAAQALNGLTNPDVFTEGFFGKAMNWGQAFNRQLSALYTTRNPEFVISNFIRDAIYSNSMVWVKEGPNYALRFHKNFGKVNPAFMVKMFAEWESGELRGKVSAMPTGNLSHMDYMRKRFYEFLMNGGETGWTNLRDIEKHKRDLERAIKREGSTSRKVWKALGGMFDLGNRSVENCARFAAYLTSREMGRSLERAIWDAKEISVNFNKKGAGDKFLNAKGQTKMGKVGAAIGGAGRGLYVFWNASLQGLNNIARATGRHPFKAAGGLMTSLYAMGVVMPLLSALVGGDDDDDKDSYYNLPEYIRRSNICFRWRKDMPWITIPLSIEFRAIYGLGELTTGVVTGKERYSDEELAKQFTSQISQVLPLDFMEGSGGWHAFVPSQIKPFVEAATNKGWTGLPIYRENKFKPYAPQWTRAYDSANKQLVEATKWLNEKTGGDDVTQGFIDWNPAKIEYMLKGYLGGVFTMYDRLQKTTETVFGQRDFDWRNIPVASRVLKQGDERTAARKARSEYSDLLHEYENTRERLRGYEKIVDSKREDYMEYAERIDFLHHSKKYTHYQILDYYKPLFDAYYKLEKDADGADKRQIQQEEDVLRREFVDLIHAVDDGKDVDVDAHIINMMNDMLKSDREEVSKAAGRAYKRHDKNGKIEKPEQPNR